MGDAMRIYQGRSLCEGVGIGNIYHYPKEKFKSAAMNIKDPQKERERFQSARVEASIWFKELQKQATEKVGMEYAQIFEIYQMILEDSEYIEAIETMIQTRSIGAADAVAKVGANIARRLLKTEDEYIKERAIDIQDISDKICSILDGTTHKILDIKEPIILVVDSLTPSETIGLERAQILGIVMRQDAANSHTAILIKNMGIPTLTDIQESVGRENQGKLAVLNAYEGTLCLEPNQEFLEKTQNHLKKIQKKQETLQSMFGKETITLDHKKIKLSANMGALEDLEIILENDAEGIGLLRSEFLFLQKMEAPTEEEQFQIYKTVAEAMGSRSVVIRTLDIGADKQAPYLHMEAQENPALGYRGIRFSLMRTELFQTQLRAILRASIYGQVSVLYPMITSVKEIQRIQHMLEDIKVNLEKEHIAYGTIKQGIMIETPAAVMLSDLLAKEVDFFSIGTNDLSQYTLALDRHNLQLDELADENHTAVLRMVQMVATHAHEAGIPVSICGELGADKRFTNQFLQMEIDELSVVPARILELRHLIRNLSVETVTGDRR